MKTIVDYTPSWSAAVEVYMLVLENPKATYEGLEAARGEIRRLAKMIDDINAKARKKRR